MADHAGVFEGDGAHWEGMLGRGYDKEASRRAAGGRRGGQMDRSFVVLTGGGGEGRRRERGEPWIREGDEASVTERARGMKGEDGGD